MQFFINLQVLNSKINLIILKLKFIIFLLFYVFTQIILFIQNLNIRSNNNSFNYYFNQYQLPYSNQQKHQTNLKHMNNRSEKLQNAFNLQSPFNKQKAKNIIQPFQIKKKSLSHKSLQKLIQQWNIFCRIQQKFNIWGYSFQMQKVLKIAPLTFYQAAIHYVFLKKLYLLIKQYDQSHIFIQSMKIKQIYKDLSMRGKLKGKKFDYLVLTTVKLIGFFLGSHTHQIIINHQLESQIYSILIFVVLGTETGPKSFSMIEQKYKKNNTLKFSRHSSVGKIVLTILDSMKSSYQKQKNTIKSMTMSKKRIGRCEFGSGIDFFHQIAEDKQDKSYLQIKQLLKTNLTVKQFVPKSKQKQTLDQVLIKLSSHQQRLAQLQEVKQLRKKQMKQKKLNFNQMSNSLDLKRDIQSLNVINNYSLKIKFQKQSKHYQMIRKQQLNIKQLKKKQKTQLKLPQIQNIKEPLVMSYQDVVAMKKKPIYWKKIIIEMKQNKFQNTEHFPPLNSKVYLRNHQLANIKEKRLSYKNQTSNKKLNAQNDDQLQYITQNKVDTSRQEKNQACRKQIQSIKRTNKVAKTSLQANTLLQQLKDQVNIIEYSSCTNQSPIYRQQQKGFLNVYTNKPQDDISKKILKKSNTYFKSISSKFQKQCEQRYKEMMYSKFNIDEFGMESTRLPKNQMALA